jgi:hypothetical protein
MSSAQDTEFTFILPSLHPLSVFSNKCKSSAMYTLYKCALSSPSCLTPWYIVNSYEMSLFHLTADIVLQWSSSMMVQVDKWTPTRYILRISINSTITSNADLASSNALQKGPLLSLYSMYSSSNTTAAFNGMCFQWNSFFL